MSVLWSTRGTVLMSSGYLTRLYGLTVHQTYRYSRLYPADVWWLKTVVSGSCRLCNVEKLTRLLIGLRNPVRQVNRYSFLLLSDTTRSDYWKHFTSSFV